MTRILTYENAFVVRVDAAGQIVSALPSGMDPAELEPGQLLSGRTVSGHEGNVVFAASPISSTPTERARLGLGGTLAIVLTRRMGKQGPSWAYFLVAGAATLVVAVIVAWQLSRRIAKPLEDAVSVTERIAGGDLDSRVPVNHGDPGELTSLAHSINVMAGSLKDSRTRERDLLLSVSHDLRTPLTSIRGFAEAITDGAVEDTAHAADVITAEARRLERLVGDLLDLTKLEASQLSISMRPTNVAEVAATTTESFRLTAERRGLQLAVHAPEGKAGSSTAIADCDPDRLAQLLANLVENAISFASSEVKVTVWPPDPGDRNVRITVDDDGPGIGPEDLDRVFERFYRADSGSRRRTGSGLGLAIVSELASAMNGAVKAQSPLTALGGTRFEVTLNRSAMPSAPPPR